MDVKAEQYVKSSLNFWYQRKCCRNTQFTEGLLLQNILLIAIISTKIKFLFTRVDTSRGNAKTALLIPTPWGIPVCQVPALISECLPPALLSLMVTFPALMLLLKNNLLWQYSAKISSVFRHLRCVWSVEEVAFPQPTHILQPCPQFHFRPKSRNTSQLNPLALFIVGRNPGACARRELRCLRH